MHTKIRSPWAREETGGVFFSLILSFYDVLKLKKMQKYVNSFIWPKFCRIFMKILKYFSFSTRFFLFQHPLQTFPNWIIWFFFYLFYSRVQEDVGGVVYFPKFPQKKFYGYSFLKHIQFTYHLCNKSTYCKVN